MNNTGGGAKYVMALKCNAMAVRLFQFTFSDVAFSAYLDQTFYFARYVQWNTSSDKPVSEVLMLEPQHKHMTKGEYFKRATKVNRFLLKKKSVESNLIESINQDCAVCLKAFSTKRISARFALD